MIAGEIIVPRRLGKGGAFMRIRVCRSRRCLKRVVARMVSLRWPRHRISAALRIPRAAADRLARREVWRG